MDEFLQGVDSYGRPVMVPADDVLQLAAYQDPGHPEWRTRFFAYDNVGNATSGFLTQDVASAARSLRVAGVPMTVLSQNSTDKAGLAVNALSMATVTSAGATGGSRLRLTSTSGRHLATAEVGESPGQVVERAQTVFEQLAIDSAWLNIAAEGQPVSLIPSSAVTAIVGPRVGAEANGCVVYLDARIGTASTRVYRNVEQLAQTLADDGVMLAPLTGPYREPVYVAADIVRAVSFQNGSTTVRFMPPMGPSQNITVSDPPEHVTAVCSAVIRGQAPPSPARGMELD